MNRPKMSRLKTREVTKMSEWESPAGDLAADRADIEDRLSELKEARVATRVAFSYDAPLSLPDDFRKEGLNRLTIKGIRKRAPNILKAIRSATRRPISAWNRRDEKKYQKITPAISVVAVKRIAFPVVRMASDMDASRSPIRPFSSLIRLSR